jgi:hypothetical protein
VRDPDHRQYLALAPSVPPCPAQAESELAFPSNRRKDGAQHVITTHARAGSRLFQVIGSSPTASIDALSLFVVPGPPPSTAQRGHLMSRKTKNNPRALTRPVHSGRRRRTSRWAGHPPPCTHWLRSSRSRPGSLRHAALPKPVAVCLSVLRLRQGCNSWWCRAGSSCGPAGEKARNMVVLLDALTLLLR